VVAEVPLPNAEVAGINNNEQIDLAIPDFQTLMLLADLELSMCDLFLQSDLLVFRLD